MIGSLITTFELKEKFWGKSLKAVEKLQRNSEIILSIFQKNFQFLFKFCFYNLRILYFR